MTLIRRNEISPSLTVSVRGRVAARAVRMRKSLPSTGPSPRLACLILTCARVYQQRWVGTMEQMTKMLS